MRKASSPTTVTTLSCGRWLYRSRRLLYLQAQFRFSLIEVRLKPLAEACVLDDLPGLVGHVHQPLAAWVLGRARKLGTHPGGRARHQDPDRRRVTDRVQVEHEQPCLEVESGARRAVEDPLKRTL